MKHFITHVFTGCLIFTILAIACSPKEKKVLGSNGEILDNLSQKAPSDMILISGNGDYIAPFYMSVAEEPNINYIIYIQWLNSVFGESYPDVVQKALPGKPHFDGGVYNEPYLKSYFTHPAFAYYPVVGLNWRQINDYLAWKTDRLNEGILIKAELINMNVDQKDEDNFNTEAYLCGQYEGSIIKGIQDEETGEERNAKSKDGILFTGYRLPTEEEWNHAAQNHFLMQNPPGKKRNMFPFGKEHPLLLWGREYKEVVMPFQLDYLDGNIPKEIIEFDIDRNKGIPETTDSRAEYKGIEYFPKGEYGLLNMSTGVKEWVLDLYEPRPRTGENWEAIMEYGGFEMAVPAVLDEEGEFVEKDSLGRMRHFRYVGLNSERDFKQVGKYFGPEREIELKIKETKAKIDDTERRIKNYKAMISPPEKAIEEYEKCLVTIATFNKAETWEQRQLVFEKYGGKVWKCRETIQKFKHDYIFPKREKSELEAELKSFGNELQVLGNRRKDISIPQRVVKGGDYDNPGLGREAVLETKGRENIGFRTVLPYTGLPVKHEYRIKWK